MFVLLSTGNVFVIVGRTQRNDILFYTSKHFKVFISLFSIMRIYSAKCLLLRAISFSFPHIEK